MHLNVFIYLLYLEFLYTLSYLYPPTHHTSSQGDSELARQIAAEISAKMDQLQFEITKKVTEDFKDPLGPLTALTQAAMAPLGECARDSGGPISMVPHCCGVLSHTHTHPHTACLSLSDQN